MLTKILDFRIETTLFPFLEKLTKDHLYQYFKLKKNFKQVNNLLTFYKIKNFSKSVKFPKYLNVLFAFVL